MIGYYFVEQNPDRSALSFMAGLSGYEGLNA
jgi:hypothetical protein